MTDWYQKAANALQLNGLGERTQEAYVRALRMLCEFYNKTPDQISEDELQQYFLQRRNVDGWSASTMCASATAASATSSRTSCNASGTP